MTHASRMLEANPNGAAVDTTALVECVEACFDCAQACPACADACLGEQDVQMLARCIRLDLDCADVCDAIGKISPGRRLSMCRWLRLPWRLAHRLAVCAARSVSNTPSTAWSTAVSVLRPAAVARAPATTSSPR